ncbi:unnamed protein product [Caenorhabditis auriculariae]|uniref:Uncharacterized protein n=1 Tax=Caenorhabditis auriculariae TaxID=2777116 RepID=A0A8S1HQX2_9PELO|nr:unnamed protein product [Caenorhabditis auriculariae]
MWVFDEILVHREGQDVEMFFEAPEDRPSCDSGIQTERLQEREVDRALDQHQRRIRFYLDTLKARTQHGGPQTKEAGVATDGACEEEKKKIKELQNELGEKDEEIKEEKEKVMKANFKIGRLTADLAQTSLELGSSLAREEILRQEVLLLRARLAEADEDRVRLAALLQMDQASTRKRRGSSTSHSDEPSVKRSRSEESGGEASSAGSPDVFRTPERGVEHARNGHDATSGQEEEEEEREPQLEEEDEVVPESDQEELSESSSSGPPSPAPSTPPRSPLPRPTPPATPPRTPTPPVQPTRRQRRAQAVMGVLKRSSRIGNTLPGPQPKPPVDAQPIPLAVLAPLTAAEVGATIQTRLADYDSGVYIQNLAVVVKLGRYLTTARRLSRNLPSSVKDLQDLESLKESLPKCQLLAVLAAFRSPFSLPSFFLSRSSDFHRTEEEWNTVFRPLVQPHRNEQKSLVFGFLPSLLRIVSWSFIHGRRLLSPHQTTSFESFFALSRQGRQQAGPY